MVINTLYNIGDKVWLMYCDKAVCGVIKGITYHKYIYYFDYERKIEIIKYNIKFNNKSIGYYGIEELFETKENLINSL